MAVSKLANLEARLQWAARQIKVLEQALVFAQDIERPLRARIDALETKLKFNSARYSEGGSGEYINNSRFEPAEETNNAA